MFIPDPDLDFLPIPDPGVKKAADSVSGSATLGGGGGPPPTVPKEYFLFFLWGFFREHTVHYYSKSCRYTRN
jgi:hypothetical protein